MVVDKVIVENDLGLLKILFSACLPRLFCATGSDRTEYLLAFAAVRLDTAILDFLSRQLLSLPMSYFTSRRTGDIQRRLDGARQSANSGATWRRCVIGDGAFAWGGGVDGALQRVAHAGLPCPPPLICGLMYFSLKVLRHFSPRLRRARENIVRINCAIKGSKPVKTASPSRSSAMRC